MDEVKGAKYDSGKPRFSLIPLPAIHALQSVLEYGAKKYSPNSWQHVPNFEQRYYDALQRHLLAWQAGEAVDPESGLPHLHHALANIAFLVAGPEKKVTRKKK